MRTTSNIFPIDERRSTAFEYSEFSIWKWNLFCIWVMWVVSRLQSSISLKRIKTIHKSLKESHSIYGSLRFSSVWNIIPSLLDALDFTLSIQMIFQRNSLFLVIEFQILNNNFFPFCICLIFQQQLTWRISLNTKISRLERN